MGTGGSLIDHGKIFQGANGFAGEIGHMIVEPSSKDKCTCGNYGCFETMISEQALKRYARTLLEEGDDDGFLRVLIDSGPSFFDLLFRASEEENPKARQILGEVTRYMTVLIHNACMTFDPPLVIIQGLYARAGDYFLHALRERIRSYPFFSLNHCPKVRYSTYPDTYEAGFIGSALYAGDTLLYKGELTEK